MAKLSEAVKLAAAAQNNAAKPTAWMFGEVLAVAPLKIRVDDRYEIGAEQVVLMREFVAGQYATHTHASTRTPTRCRSTPTPSRSKAPRRRTGTPTASPSRPQRALP